MDARHDVGECKANFRLARLMFRHGQTFFNDKWRPKS